MFNIYRFAYNRISMEPINKPNIVVDESQTSPFLIRIIIIIISEVAEMKHATIS
jgi:hypothetical protein